MRTFQEIAQEREKAIDSQVQNGIKRIEGELIEDGFAQTGNKKLADHFKILGMSVVFAHGIFVITIP